MNTRFTMDPISWHEVENLDTAYCVYDGDGDNGIEIFFENKENQQIYLALGKDQCFFLHISIRGNELIQA